jgi:hypothetical protein
MSDGGFFSGDKKRSGCDYRDIQSLYPEFNRNLSQPGALEKRSGGISLHLSSEISIISDKGE